PAMAVRDITLVTEKANPPPRFHNAGKLVELTLGVWRREMRLIDSEEVFELSAAGGEPALLGRAERAQVQIGDPAFIKPRGELPLGKSRTARRRNGAGIDDEIHVGAAELVEKSLRRYLFIADRAERGFHASFRSGSNPRFAFAQRGLRFFWSVQPLDERHGGRRRVHFSLVNEIGKDVARRRAWAVVRVDARQVLGFVAARPGAKTLGPFGDVFRRVTGLDR